MKFHTVIYPERLPLNKVEYPCVFLRTHDWNDFGYYTLYTLSVFLSKNERIVNEDIKILQIDNENPEDALSYTKLSSTFTKLKPSFCSLGQSLSYYEQLYEAGPNIYNKVLIALNDLVHNPLLVTKFEFLPAFKISLLRFSDAEKAFREAGAIFDNIVAEQLFKFSFQCRVPGAHADHVVNFDFTEHPTGLNRTTVIIGRNGTGKTQFLAEFALAMSGLGSLERLASFTPRRPSFSEVIAVSYSVFDEFSRPDENTFSYAYCGIRAPNEKVSKDGQLTKIKNSTPRFLTPLQLEDKLKKSIQIISNSPKRESWISLINTLLEGIFEQEQAKDIFFNLDFYKKLSSGQRILVNIITDITARITSQSIILFDEPEIHLHPEIFAALIRAFDQLLHAFDSYAIIATHSPMLLQETLSRQVRIFKRVGAYPKVSYLTNESFGEDLTTVTQEVFAVQGSSNNYRAHLAQLAKNRTAEEVESLFPKGLPFQAEAYLQALTQYPDSEVL